MSLRLIGQSFSLLGHVEAEARQGDAGGEVVIPGLLGHHDQSEVDLDTESDPHVMLSWCVTCMKASVQNIRRTGPWP